MKTADTSAPRGTAPDIAENYPSGGERLGPAWQRAWDVMADGRWYTRREIGREVAARVEISSVTVENMLRQAGKAGLVETKLATDPREPQRPGQGRARKRVAWVRRAGSSA